MKIIKSIKTGLAVSMMFMLGACNSWLEVEPDDRIMDNALFRDREGFMAALNGVYSEMNGEDIYGSNLSMGMLDVMAQYYNCSGSNHAYGLYMDYSYTDDQYKKRIDKIWTQLYLMIANCNAIIEHCGDGNPVLPDTYYRMIKGESLGLRAMMHLDLLRMFGPIWSESSKGTACMPYMTKADRVVQPLLSADSVMIYIVRDLETASELLGTVDPVITEGAKNYYLKTGSYDMHYRQYRMNYFAVNALLARAYLWSGNTAKAGEYARAVIEKVSNKDKPLFPLVDADYMRENPDQVFSPEVLFSLYNGARLDNVYKAFFDPTLSASKIFSMKGGLTDGRVKDVYDDKNDYRYRMWGSIVDDGREVVYLTKFKDESSDSAYHYRYMIPLVRVSELNLIAAECEMNVQTALEKYLNPLRLSRNCVNLNASSPGELKTLIQAEYLKEFIGEGQLFFYYKRNGLQTIPDGTTTNSTKNIALESYVFPLPESEISQRAGQKANVSQN